MGLEIIKLSPQLLDDYMNYFDNEAFTDHKEWAGCYCMFFHYETGLENKTVEKVKSDAAEFIKTGRLCGYLAYLDGRVVGWCNVNEKTAFSLLKGSKELWGNEEEIKSKAVVCFLVAPDMRGKGIAKLLLKKACEDAAEEGYAYIEGYPPAEASDMFTAYHGTRKLFEDQGFILYKDLKSSLVMRKKLK